MHNLIAQRQGQPVLFLCLLTAGWLLLRAATWENPLLPPAITPDLVMMGLDKIESAPGHTDRRTGNFGPPSIRAGNGGAGAPRVAHKTGRLKQIGFAALVRSGKAESGAGNLHLEQAVAPRLAESLGELAVASTRDQSPEPTDRPVPSVREDTRAASSAWRIDAWLVVREGRSLPTEGGSRPASYGGSQVGAVLAYSLDRYSARRPAAYFRANRDLGSDGQTDTALGLRVRPLAKMPIDFHAEARATHRDGSTELRPAAFVAGGFEQVRLPEVTARAYGQAGYVGGDFATPFADGALVVERRAVNFGPGGLSLGAGAWGGAQKGASRVDVGPAVTLNLSAAGAPVRLEAGYRVRVAGNAAPGNGGVLTLSTGF
ncbi:hypothetical protein BA950_02065 [Erythrobacter sp. SAORIC-644]|uniref:hypothetical protein n=1 Tax=Erythrobacter sp. SAORIC-644 TaxID=1869314 RepID=UPI000C9EF2F1|nr:hypothetical protein [Erythrobacter sp. SAORIC-644]PNQ77826.1 hypothetical protein BA950_02065 [Erythrobacter sp. SAORIC-644]